MSTYSLQHTITVLETVVNNLKKFPKERIPKPKQVASYIQELALDLNEHDGWTEEEGPQE